jgi:hypothetical protein
MESMQIIDITEIDSYNINRTWLLRKKETNGHKVHLRMLG